VTEIKGFSLGMDFEAARVHCVRVFLEAGLALRPFEEMLRKVDLSVFVIAWTDPGGEAVMEISADQSRRVIRVVFYPEALEPLFGLEQPDDETIAAMLQENVHVPDLAKDPFGEARWEREVPGKNGSVERISVRDGYVVMEMA
jgi:hypothetical protein